MRYFILTPRVKSLILLNNLMFFFFFFKNFYYFNFFLTHLNLNFNFFLILYKFFYYKQIIFFFKKITLDLVGFYVNNLIKSIVFKFFYFLFHFISKIPVLLVFNKSRVLLNDIYNYNTYHFSHKTLNVQINKIFFKNFFFLLLFFSNFYWYQHTNFFSFYLNFILINVNVQISPFYNGYFFPIYHM